MSKTDVTSCLGMANPVLANELSLVSKKLVYKAIILKSVTKSANVAFNLKSQDT